MYKHILLAADGSENSLRAADEAIKIASLVEDSLIEIIYIVDFDDIKADVLHSESKVKLDHSRRKHLIPFEEINAQIWSLRAEVFLPCAASRFQSTEKKHGKAGRKGYPERKPVSPGPVPSIFPLAWKWAETLPGHVRLMIFRSGQIFIYYSAGKIASGLDIR